MKLYSTYLYFKRKMPKIFLRGLNRRRYILLTPFAILILLVTVMIMRNNEDRRSFLADKFHDLSHFRRNFDLKHYMDNIQLLIEPTYSCQSLDPLPVVVMVTSSPDNFDRREAIRNTWGKHLPTFFVLGIHGSDIDSQLVDNYVEAKMHSDLVVFDLKMNYQNLTLKTAVLMRWALERCPQAQFLLKTDDDVLVNPWLLKELTETHADEILIGYRINDTTPCRSPLSKWYMPQWLYPELTIPEYLSGTGYMVNVEDIRRILKEANKVPLVNLEDIFFTYLVASKKMHLRLTHESSMSPFKPVLPLSCAYWSLALSHSYTDKQMVRSWSRIEYLGKKYEKNETVCGFYKRLNLHSLLLTRYNLF